MKRDLDLIRKILLYIEEHPSKHRSIPSSAIKIDGYDTITIDFHLRLLQDSGYVNIPTDTKAGRLMFAHYDRLTEYGFQYLDSVRNSNIWHETKEKLKSVGGSVALSVIQDVASSLIKSHWGF